MVLIVISLSNGCDHDDDDDDGSGDYFNYLTRNQPGSQTWLSGKSTWTNDT